MLNISYINYYLKENAQTHKKQALFIRFKETISTAGMDNCQKQLKELTAKCFDSYIFSIPALGMLNAVMLKIIISIAAAYPHSLGILVEKEINPEEKQLLALLKLEDNFVIAKDKKLILQHIESKKRSKLSINNG